MNNDRFGRTPGEIEDAARHSYAEGTVVFRAIADDFREIAVKGATISRGRLGLLHDRLSAVSRITAVPAGEPVTGPANPDIIDHLFDATEGIDTLRTVEDDEEGQR
jgi:PII-like signaling protein